MTQPNPAPERCYIATVDGQPIRVQGAQPTTPEAKTAIEEVVRAALRRMESEPPGPLTVDCAHCGQPAGQFCRNAAGRITAVHASRRAALAPVVSLPQETLEGDSQ